MRGQSRAPRRAVLIATTILAVAAAGAGPAAAITGGADIPAGDLAFVAKLAIGDNQRACSGALVHPQLVLTAKACFAGADGSVPDGAPFLPTTVTVGQSGSEGATWTVSAVVAHPDRDLALARLDGVVPSVEPVRIATSAPEAGEQLTIAGFGRTATEWVPERAKSAPVTVGDVGATLIDITAEDGGAGLCRGDAGGPALRVTGGSVVLAGVHHASNEGGCLGEAQAKPAGSETRVDDVRSWVTENLPGFRSGFESGDTRLNWQNTATTANGITNVVGLCCNLTGPELLTGPLSGSHGGSQVLLYSGKDNSTTRSFAYLKAFGQSNVQVRPSTVLSYWIYPQSKTSFASVEGNNSTCVAVDLNFVGGTSLRDSGVLDQRGNRVHPFHQCGKLPLDTWTQIVVPVGTVAAGKRIASVSVGYDQAANLGGYRGYIDDVAITDVLRHSRFETGLEPEQPALNWENTVSATIPGGGLKNAAGICCGLTGPEAKLGSDERAHGGGKVLLYSGKDTNATSSHAYLQAFAPGDVYVTPTTRLSYWIYPQSKDGFPYAEGTNSTCVALDLIFLDNVDGARRSLRDAGVRDQDGQVVHPTSQCTKLTLDAWNYVSAPLGAVANGKQIVQIDVGYDQPAGTGGYRGFIDDIRITE